VNIFIEFADFDCLSAIFLF